MSVPTEVIVSIITVFGGGVISLLLFMMRIVLKVNEAVNEREKRVTPTGEIPPKLFDMVYESNQLIKQSTKNLSELTEKCNNIESTISEDIFPRLQSVESRQNFFVEALKKLDIQQSKLEGGINLADELPDGDE